MVLRRLLLTASVALVCTAGVAKAETIATLDLSTHSSDATPAAWLLATFTFTVNNAGTQLTLLVENKTQALGPPGAFGAYDIREIYFNGNDIFGLAVTTDHGWDLRTNDAGDGFGNFDFTMDIDSNSAGVIAAGASLEFVFNITGGTTATAADFVSNFSTVPPGDTPAIIAAKFVHGPVSPDSPGGDDSAYGAFVPLPPALPMGIAGLIGVAFLRRRTQGK